MLKLILYWLKSKKNYAHYQTDVDSFLTYKGNFSDMLFSGRIYLSDMRASDCYIIHNISNKIDYFLEHPGHHRHNFENFNVKWNEYIYDKVKMKEASKNFTSEDSMHNRITVIDLLNQLKHSYSSKKLFLEESGKYTYKDIFYDINENSFGQFQTAIEDNLKESIFSFKDFKSVYIDRIQDESRGLNEIGIFYPFVFNHDIFEQKYYLFEINHLKFQKPNHNFLNIVENFYKKNGTNYDMSKNLFTLNEYFMHPGFEYSKHFAYFNPFKNYEKYKKEYEQLKLNIAQNKLDFNTFINELFDFFNKVQIGIVKFQHENLLSALTTARSKDRQYSIRELIDIQIKKIESYKGLYDYKIAIYLGILYALKQQPSNFKFTKNTKIEEIEYLKDVPESIKHEARLALDDLLVGSNKHSTSELQYIFEHYKNQANKIIKKYKLNVSNKNIIYDMLLDLIYFYNDKNKEKLSNPFNTTIEKIYQKHQHRDIEDLVNFSFQNEFIQKYSNMFDKYTPHEIETSDGKKYYMALN